jgi:hypothetical protein
MAAFLLAAAAHSTARAPNALCLRRFQRFGESRPGAPARGALLAHRFYLLHQGFSQNIAQTAGFGRDAP